jgi:hypothetical protein
MADELAKLADKIKTILSGDDDAVKTLVKKLLYKDGDVALKALMGTEERLEKLLMLYIEDKARLQQQSIAGMSMLPVRQEAVVFPWQKSCCIHQQTL